MNRYLAPPNLWPDGWTKLRVYYLPRSDEISELLDAYRPVLEQFDCIAPVPGQWLHETLAVLQDRPARAVSAEQRSALETALRERVGSLPAFSVTAGGALASRHGVMLDLTPDRDFAELQRRARTAVASIFGAVAARYDGGRPHIPLAYGTGPGDSAVIQGQLRNATDLRATLTVDDVRLVDVTQDLDLQTVRWEELARIPLRTGSSRS